MPSPLHRSRHLCATLLALLLAASAAAAQQPGGLPAACPTEPTRVARSVGGVVDYLGTVPGIPDLCRMNRPDGPGDFYFGVWRSDWPGAGLAYPAIRATIAGGTGTRVSFVTRSVPGLQWTDSFINGGEEAMEIGGQRYTTLKLAHERDGIEGNTYHSIITGWRDVKTGIVLKVVEQQIAGQSYGPSTTWTAMQVTPVH